ncbi:MAG: protein translocase subunit SecD [Bacilli bacterium]|nr:protein translocase subunit SecD [Bacilli bacterium]
MKKKHIISLVVIGILLVVMGLTLKPLFNDLNYGLDLQGGFEVLYQVEPIDGDLTSDMVTNTYKTLLKRIDVLGVSEPAITIEGSDRIRVGLAGISDPQVAREILGKQASLTFRDTSDNLLMTSEVLKSGGAKVTTDEKGRPAVSLSISNKDKFYQVTNDISKSEDNRIVIWLDYSDDDSFATEENKCGSDTSNCLSAATVSQGFASDVIITGNFTEAEVRSLVDLINSGSLPTDLTEISSRTVGAQFGEDSLNKTFAAGAIGIAIIMLVMTLIYRFAGLISCLGILVYTYVTFLLFYLIGGVLTLPGIAALVIGVGMAIDTCVINFARIKDELKKGNSLKVAYKKGNKNSLLTIIDSNITTFLVALILFIFGESSVKGFATMLMLSIFVTFIVMLYFNRYLLKIFVETGLFDYKSNVFIGYNVKKEKKEKFKNLNFISIGKKYGIFISIFIILGVASLFFRGLNLGLDFKGGTSINVKGDSVLIKEDLTSDISTLGYNLVEIERVDDTNYIMTIDNVLTADEIAKTENYFDNKYEVNTDIGVISNVVKRDLIFNAIRALIFASIGIIIYISLRFKFSYAVGGIVALIHDAFIIIVLFSMMHLEVSGIFVAAILSIIGYSINDTIVTFDRIRENMKDVKEPLKKDDLINAVNTSIRQTLTRSIITTLTTLIPVTALILFGSHEIINFNIALLIGLISGTLSSILVASQLWYYLEKRNIGKLHLKKWYEED